MDALYAYSRLTDDLSDAPGELDNKHTHLQDWRAQLQSALDGQYSHPIHPALHHSIIRFQIDPRLLFEIIDGVESDLRITRYATFDDLYPYCYRVASAVGLACIAIWGCHDPAAKAPAEAAGIAFQLTNILRDLGEDFARGRVYLPESEWQMAGCPAESWQERTPAFREMMRFQLERAKEYYAKARVLDHYLPSPGRLLFQVMWGTYRQLLQEIENCEYDVFSSRVKVPRWRKLRILASAWWNR